MINAHSWRLPGHPRAKDESPTIIDIYASNPRQWEIPISQLSKGAYSDSKTLNPTIPPLEYKHGIMPPLSHIIRFYTSVATVYIAPEPELGLKFPSFSRNFGTDKPLHKVCLPNGQEHITVADLDPEWQGKGQLHTLVYISRWCPDFVTYEREERHDYNQYPERLNVLLIESVEGWGEVKRRVQMLDYVNLLDWRKAEPRWELMSLA